MAAELPRMAPHRQCQAARTTAHRLSGLGVKGWIEQRDTDDAWATSAEENRPVYRRQVPRRARAAENIENFKELAGGPAEALCVVRAAEAARAIRAGRARVHHRPRSIAKAAGYGPDYFHKRYYDVPASKQAVGSGLPGYHTGLGHFYLYRGEPVTHPSSAAAWGANIRALIEQERQARVPGWHGPRTCPVSAGSTQAACMSPSPLPHWGRISEVYHCP